MPMDLHNPEVSDNKKTEKHFKRTAPRQISNWIIKKPRLLVSNTNVGKYIPSTSTLQSTNISSKMQHSTMNQTDPKHHVFNNQHNKSPLKHTKVTATHIQTSNKQIIDRNQLPIFSKLVPTTKQKVNINQNVKPAIIHQPSVKDIKCIKYLALLNDHTYAACHMISHLKNIAVTEIGTPSTSAVVVPQSPVLTSSKPIDVPSSSKNSDSCEEPQIDLLSSEDEDEELCSNPKLLEDRLSQKDLSVKDCYTIEGCQSVHNQTSNKQIINRNQLPILSKLVSTTKQKVNINANVKPAIIHQQPVKYVIKCITCRSLSKEQTCEKCCTFTSLKNVALTEIGTPSTSAVVVPQSPVLTSSKPIDVPSSSKNSDSCEEPQIDLLSSEDEDEELCSNPKLLEDRLSQKDLSVKDCYTIEGCQSVHNQTSNKQIINRNQLPILSKLVSTTKQKVNINANVKPAIIHQQPVKYVIKCITCRSLSKEQTCEKCCTFTSLKNVALTKIGTPSTSAVVVPQNPVLTSSKPIDVPSSSKNSDSCEEPQIDLLSSEDEDEELCSNPKLLEDRLSQKNSGVEYNCQIEGCQSVHNDSFNTVPNCSSRIIEEPMLSITQPTNARFELLEHTTILKDRLGNHYSVIRISDYRMLNTNKFINDNLIEFYLNYWYTKKLSDEDRNRTYVFGTHFYSTLAKSFNTSKYPSHYTASQIRYDNVKKWTKNVDIFKKDFVFIPINENNHWFMAVVCFPYLSGKVNMKDGTPVDAPDDNAGRYTPPPTHHHQTDGRNEADPNVEDLWLFDMASTRNLFYKQGIDYETDVAVTKMCRQIQVKRPCILVFDSLSGGVQRAKIAATLRCWLEQEYIAKYNGKKDFSPQAIKGALLRLPQQPNYTDCGLFMIHFFKKFFERPIVDYTLPIRHLENWFSIDEVVKNCRKRRELQSIILNRIEERGSILPYNIKLPIIDFTDPPNSRL